MRPPLRSISALILLVAAITVLTSRSLLRRRSLEPPPVPATTLDGNLLRLASLSAAESEQRKHVSHLLAATLTASSVRDDVFLTLSIPADSSGRRFHRSRTRAPSCHIHHILRRFRPSLRDRLANRSAASDHLRLIKRRIDLHYGYPDTGRPYASCAVVGNSGVLLSSDHGDLIDGHDLVIRLNNARTAGYERHVGFKTSVSFINSNVLRLCARREGCACHPYGGFVPIVIYLCQPAHFVDYLACNYSHPAPLLVTDPRLDALCSRIVKYYSMKRFVEETGRRPEEWGEVHDDAAFHYSSGMEAVVLGLGICEQVSLFGFGKLEGVKHHYHTNQKEELKLHDYAAEYAFYHDLVERPEVIPFLEDSGFKIRTVFLYQ